MITSTVTLCALPETLWREKAIWGNQTFTVSSFVEDALGVELRLTKGVNQENERARYTLCCARLEAEIKLAELQEVKAPSEFKSALAGHKIPTITLGQDYIDVIKVMHQKADSKSIAMRLGASFFLPEHTGSHINAFASLASDLNLAQLTDIKLRIAFFQFAQLNKCGIVEIQNPFSYAQSVNPQVVTVKINKPDFVIETNDEDSDFDNEGRNVYDILRDQIERAIYSAKERKPYAVNFSNQPHNVITEILNEYAYSASGRLEEPICIQVIYTDGSQAEDLPLRCLPSHDTKVLENLMKLPPLKASLLSMRHLEMDDKVDISWFRNREVSKARAFGETDRFCYAETKKQLFGTRKKERFVLHLYQTGLQPAIIGFYRALIEELSYRAKYSPSLLVIPFYYGKSGYKQGKLWY